MLHLVLISCLYINDGVSRSALEIQCPIFLFVPVTFHLKLRNPQWLLCSHRICAHGNNPSDLNLWRKSLEIFWICLIALVSARVILTICVPSQPNYFFAKAGIWCLLESLSLSRLNHLNGIYDFILA